MGLSQRRRRLVARLRVNKTRERERAVLVEGVRAVSEALDCGVEVAFAMTSAKLTTSEAGAALASRLSGYDAVALDDAELDSLSDTARPQGVVLVCREPVSGFDALSPGGRLLILDGVQDPGNVGTLVRAAVGFGLDAVVGLDGTADPWGAKAVRASAGMIFRIPVLRVPAPDVLARLGEIVVPLYVADPDGADVEQCAAAESFALALGNEGGGVRPALVQAAHRIVGVHMPGPAESLNVAMAGSVLLHVLTRGDSGGE